MRVLSTSLEGVLITEPDVFRDKRGFFIETFHRRRYEDAGIKPVFVQDNLSYSIGGALRGLHFQFPHAQAKIIQVITGEIFDVAVDIRQGSPTFGQWAGIQLSEENARQVFIPEGFAHGFCVLSETAFVVYKCTDFYEPSGEQGILWSDPDLGIEWPLRDPLLSDKDRNYPCLKNVSSDRLPKYTGIR